MDLKSTYLLLVWHLEKIDEFIPALTQTITGLIYLNQTNHMHA